MQKLTKREKTLLYVLLYIVLISLSIFLLILPAQSSLAELQGQNETAQVELTTLKNNSIKYANLTEELNKATEAVNEQKEKFHVDLLAEDVDALLTAMVKRYALTPAMLSISDITDEELLSYEDFLAIQDGTKITEDVSKDTIRVYNVSMSVGGSITNVQKLVNDANVLKTLRVASVSYSESNVTDGTIMVTFKLYII